MITAPQAFCRLWEEEHVREALFALLDPADMGAVRLASRACRDRVTARLFMRTHVTFTASTFTKASRVAALARIGRHVEHLTFCMAHSDATFLPPLLHPQTGREISFVYKPHTTMGSALTRPRYGNAALGDVFTQQYPPLFHAATNVPSFLHALQHLVNLRHVTVRCPGQPPQERYRRGMVDYALVSLRIALERAPLLRLEKLSLSGVHPAAFFYLKHAPGALGARPSAPRRWRQIRKLHISVDAWDFAGPAPGRDHLQLMDDYVRQMAPQLEKLSFTWLDGAATAGRTPRQGPCPLVRADDAPAPRGRPPLHMPRLRCLTLRNTALRTAQLRDLVARHQTTLRAVDCENVALVDGGRFAEALAPLLDETSRRGSRVWRRGDPGAGRDANQHSVAIGLDAGLDFRPDDALSALSSASSVGHGGPAAVASPDDLQLDAPSAAVVAVARDLLHDADVGGGDALPRRMDDLVAEVAQGPYRGPAACTYAVYPTIAEEDEDEAAAADAHGESDEGYHSEAAPDAEAACTTFSTQLTKRRRRHRHGEDRDGRHGHEHGSKSSERRDHRERRHHSRSRSRKAAGELRDKGDKRERDKSRNRRDRRDKPARDRAQPPVPPLPVAAHRFAHRTPPPPPGCVSAVDVCRPATPSSPVGRSPAASPSPGRTPSPRSSPRISHGSAVVAPLQVAPWTLSDVLPVLQPTVYDPGIARSASAYSTSSTESERLLQHRRLADDPVERSSRLQKAKAAVLQKLSREFTRRLAAESVQRSVDAAGATAAVAVAEMAPAPPPSSLLGGLRWRERLFGESLLGEFAPHHSMESNSTMVPLILGRA